MYGTRRGRRKAHLLHDDSEDESSIDLGLLRGLQDSIVDSALLRAAIILHHGCELVQFEHVVVVHPVTEGREVVLDAAEAPVEVWVFVARVSCCEGVGIPF